MRFIFLLSLLPGIDGAQDPEALTRRRLTSPAVYDGVHCAPTGRAHASFFPDGALAACPLHADTTVAGHRLPAGTWIYLTRQRRLHAAWLARDTDLEGHRCRGAGYREWITEFHLTGPLRLCYLAGDAVIDGVPCHGASFLAELRRNTQVQFHPNGRLRECRLARPVTRAEGRFKPPARLTLDSTGTVLGTTTEPSPFPPDGRHLLEF